MPVARYPVQPVQEVLLCSCGAEMEHYPGAHIWREDKPRFQHGCPKCHQTQYADKVYPEIVFERLDQPTNTETKRMDLGVEHQEGATTT